MRSAIAAKPVPNSILGLCGGMVTIGGAERMILAAIALFRKQGARVHCVLNEWEYQSVAAALEPLGVTWASGPYRRPMLKRTQTMGQRIIAIFGMFVTSGDLVIDWLRHRSDVLFAPEFGAVLRNGPGIVLLRLFGVKVLLYLQNAPPSGAFYEKLFRIGIDRLVDRYVVASDDSRLVLEKFGIRASKIDCVTNFAPPRADPETVPDRISGRIVFVGQIIPQKGLDLLLEALSIVVGLGAAASLDVVGKIDGWIHPSYASYREAIIVRAAQVDLAGRVSFLGWREDIPEILMRASIHCAPSRPEMYEGMPLVCLEAKRSGTPSVVTPVGPFPEIVEHEVSGYIVRDVSADALVDGLMFFLSDAARACNAGVEARKSSAAFSAERFEVGWERVLHNLSQDRT